MLDNCSITDPKKRSNIWFDQTYGFKTIETFNVYMRIAYLHKSRIRTYLTKYFNITDDQIKCITNNDTNLIQTSIQRYSMALNELFFDKFCHLSGGDSCSGVDYAMIQWADAGVTNDIGKVNI